MMSNKLIKNLLSGILQILFFLLGLVIVAGGFKSFMYSVLVEKQLYKVLFMEY
uniref:Uncharacterized protein n=1 Tax=Clostridioides difficile TaxID=1496 RepID=A0A381ICH7_CLODI|nr:Uncharacterised protein [Clostridioides difficile]